MGKKVSDFLTVLLLSAIFVSAFFTVRNFSQIFRATLKKTRQNSENKQTFDLTGKNFELREKLVKTLKINKLLI